VSAPEYKEYPRGRDRYGDSSAPPTRVTSMGQRSPGWKRRLSLGAPETSALSAMVVVRPPLQPHGMWARLGYCRQRHGRRPGRDAQRLVREGCRGLCSVQTGKGRGDGETGQRRPEPLGTPADSEANASRPRSGSGRPGLGALPARIAGTARTRASTRRFSGEPLASVFEPPPRTRCSDLRENEPFWGRAAIRLQQERPASTSGPPMRLTHGSPPVMPGSGGRFA
jgi:hypothetical protein